MLKPKVIRELTLRAARLRLRSPEQRRLRFLSLVLIATTLLAAFAGIRVLHDERVADTENALTDSAVMLGEQVARSFQAVDLVVRETRAMVLGAGISDVDQFRSKMATEDIHRYLLDRLESLPQANAIALLDDNGKIINSSRSWPVLPMDVSDRDFYVYWHTHDNPRAFIGVPIINRITGNWVILLTRRISGPDGRLLGIVAAVIEADYLESFYHQVAPHNGQAIALFRDDGTLLARYPHLESMMGTQISAKSGWYKSVAVGGGTFRTPGYISGVAHFIATRPIPEYPLVVTVGVSEADALAPWRQQSMMILIAALAVGIGFAVLFRVLGVQFWRVHRGEDRFRDFAMTSSDWFWETDVDHRFSYLSEGIGTFGFQPRDLVGRSRKEIAAASGNTGVRWDDHFDLLEHHEPFRDFVYTWKNSVGREGVASVSGNPFFDSAGRFLGYRGTGRDITEQVRSESLLRETKEAAEAANMAKSQFLANMSHELRTPLNAIIGFSESLELGIRGPLEPEQIEYIRLIHQSGEHLHNVINDILDLAKVDAGKFELHDDEKIDPQAIVESTVTLMRSHAVAAEIRLSTEIQGPLGLLICDSTRLKQILLNLISNALKFTERGGSVVVAAHRGQDGSIVFEVRDTGHGMSAEEIDIALQPFGQVDSGHTRRYEGTGLGLPLAQKLAELHGGSLHIQSEKSRGTTVTVTLPASRVVDENAPADRLATAASHLVG
ncbi:MAG TPA: ATP-binding protein [Stellaceae bacterium]|nr:ATP-binding protein [Stellaceae bacterium]